ncbi:hypothetical protein BDB00DRAFT_879526 [Zychaea mexicana]|uniref:uncharacterized protein n=1 Tax=Zychaea mexicana TaxID=64656 RepID=UPI0022FE30B3|nr:uncharacterized protein BDB00DRAFT_879526 [Zychaea mexicana]KAI9477073.1 hypothetical protein BDB00DRAFT_879526 [Zychaea mexicana]
MSAIVNTLPPEIVQLIFGLLDLEQLVRCLRVCKEWHRILISLPHLWRHVQLSSRFQGAPERYAQALTNLIHLAGDHLQWLKLDIELSEVLGIQALQLIAANGCKHLEGLELNNTSGPEERLLLLRALRNIGPMTAMSYLQLYCLEINMDDVVHLFDLFPNLTYLDLSDSVLYDSGDYTSSIPSGPAHRHHRYHHYNQRYHRTTRLKSLTLNHIEGASSAVFGCLLQSCPQLEQFHCRGALLSYEIIQHLNRYNRSLRVLAYGLCAGHHADQHDFVIPPPPVMLEIGLESVLLEQVNDQDLAAIVSYSAYHYTLSKLDIRSCFIPDDTMAQLLLNSSSSNGGWSSLRQLDLSSVTGLSLPGLFTFLDACPNLEKLSFKDIPWWRVTNATLDRWTHYKNLVDIRYFGQPESISQAAIQQLIAAKYAVLQQQRPGALHFEFNRHTRIHIQFPTQYSVDDLILLSRLLDE